MPIATILYLLSFICFVVACFPVATRVNLIALGLAFWVLTHLLGLIR